MDKDLINSPIQYIKGVGPKRASLLNHLGIITARDALYYLPYRYEDRKNLKNICSLTYGQMETVAGKIIAMEVASLPKSRVKIFELIVSDGTGLLKCKWFNQPFMKRYFKVGQETIFSGIVKYNPYWKTGFEMDNPEYEFAEEDAENLIHTSRIVPVYRATAGLSVRVLRSIISTVLEACLDSIKDPVPEEILQRHGLAGLKQSLYNSHFPEPEADVNSLNRGAGKYLGRLAFDELFNLELGIALIKKGEAGKSGIPFNPEGALVRKLLQQLSFRLTQAQVRVFNEILHDMNQPYPMHRMVQGDVGCGKTIIALMAMLTVVECGYQATLMAPTEILAEQHYLNIHQLVEAMGLRIGILTGSKKQRPVEDIEAGNMDIIVGTHALIQEGVKFKKLGLAVIDEQHRFGVMQRAALRKKARNPDVLVMTATPIPRTLAMTLYGDLDCSTIDELPPNRTPVITKLLDESRKPLIYQAMATEVNKGRQVYVVYPVIEESENSDLKCAITGETALKSKFPDFRIGLIHGKMKTAEREAVMTAFKNREIDILVSTTVIEVGVDVPNAALMLIVHAERFGLSQLHQLRGRVGRGSEQAQCFLLAYNQYGEEGRRRLNIMTKTSDGFRIAEEDLNIRGPGEFLGTRQSGLPDLRIADIVRDSGLLEIAKKEAFDLINKDPELQGTALLKRTVESFWKNRIDAFKTG